MIDGEELGLPGVLYVAGEEVAPGRYRRVGGFEQELHLPDGGRLPPSFDGRVAVYAPVVGAPHRAGRSA